MNTEFNFDNIIKKIQQKNPEFTDFEIRELCESYISTFPKKTKTESIMKSLEKYMKKEFELSEDTEKTNITSNIKEYSLENFPKSYFGNGKFDRDACLLKINNLSKIIGNTHLFDETNLQINGKDKIALIGRNGAGKSTLLKIIIGIEEADSGLIEKSKGLNVGYLSQDIFWNSRNNILKDELLSIFPEITQNINRLSEIKQLLQKDENNFQLIQEKINIEERLKNNDGYNKYARQIEIIKYFGFNENQLSLKIGDLSGGEQTKVQIAKFCLKNVDLLILDEPTNHLDIEGIIFLEKFCKLWPKALICISHDKKFINNVFDKIIEISEKKFHTYFGDYNSYLEQKQKRYDLQLKNYNTQQKELEKQNEFIERFRYKASKASQVQSRIKMLEKVDIIDAPIDEITVRDIRLNIDIRLPNLIINLNKVTVGYDKPLITISKNIEVTSDKKIGIIGKNGVGKTTLLKSILGETPLLSGNCTINDRIKIGSYSQTAQELNREKTILEELVGPGISQTDVRTMLGGLLIIGDKVNQKIGTLSGGERAKVALTKMLLEKPHLIIMDEPTNHLDLYSKESIKNMLKQFPGVSLIVSHDRDLLENISNQLWVIKEGKMEVFDNLERGFNEIS